MCSFLSISQNSTSDFCFCGTVEMFDNTWINETFKDHIKSSYLIYNIKYIMNQGYYIIDDIDTFYAVGKLIPDYSNSPLIRPIF